MQATPLQHAKGAAPAVSRLGTADDCGHWPLAGTCCCGSASASASLAPFPPAAVPYWHRSGAGACGALPGSQELSKPLCCLIHACRRDPKPSLCCGTGVLLQCPPLSARMVLESAQEALTAAKQSIMGEGKQVGSRPISCLAQSAGPVRKGYL